MNRDEVTALMKAIKKLEKTYDGDSNDDEHDAAVELTDLLREVLHRNYGTLTVMVVDRMQRVDDLLDENDDEEEN